MTIAAATRAVDHRAYLILSTDICYSYQPLTGEGENRAWGLHSSFGEAGTAGTLHIELSCSMRPRGHRKGHKIPYCADDT